MRPDLIVLGFPLTFHRKGLVLKSVVARACILIMFACGGCAAAVPIVAGVGGAVPVVGQHMGQGEEDSFWIARYDDVVKAAFRAQEKLSLKIKDKKIDKKHADLALTDDRDQEIVLQIERLTETVTRVHLDAGSQAFAGLAHLLARQIAQELKDADAFLVHWSDDAQ
jgi:hypothetical protein